MQYSIKAGHGTFGWCVLGFMFIILFATQGCDSGTGIDRVHSDSDGRETTDRVRYVYGTLDSGEEHAVEVILDKGLIQERRTFNSEDEYHEEVERLLEEDELTLSAPLYHQLIHALYPAEIRLLDMEGEVVIGEYVYSMTEEASYRYPVNDPNSTLELEEYWGEDGREVERELSKFYSLIGMPELLSTQSFKNPFIQSQADEFVLAAKSFTPSQNSESFGPVPTGRHVNVSYTKITTVCLPSEHAGTDVSRRCYSVRFINWNQSIGRGRSGRRAFAGTESQVYFENKWRDLDYQGPPGLETRLRLDVEVKGGGSWSSKDECDGQLRVGILDYSKNPPYSQLFEHERCTSVTANAYRSPGKGATSYHDYGFTDHFFPYVINGKTYLIYRPIDSGDFSRYLH